MWTPKRIVLLAVGGAAFLATYLVYVNFLGGIDGLPPLPPEYWPDPDRKVEPPPPRGTPLVVKKLWTAFGRGCAEADWAVKLDVHARGLVLAAKDFQFVGGRVRLWPLSVAVFGKDRGPDGAPEINTVRSDVAYLEFERPVSTLADMGKYRIIAGELAGNVRVVNNRRTAPRDDDLFLDVPTAKVLYDQRGRSIHTDGFVTLTDTHSKPFPTVIKGKGLEVDLLAESADGAARPPRRRQGGSVTGVRRVRLLSAVDMRFHVDARSEFLSMESDTAAPKPKQKAGPPEKAHVIITTPGVFEYDVQRDFARFDIPPRKPGQVRTLPEHVVVQRVHDLAKGLYDQLLCEHLELQFRKKEAKASGGANTEDADAKPSGIERSMNLQIDSAHATGRSVVLTSDRKMLAAHGNDFHYDARNGLTVLKGKPMLAIQDGNEIEARELRIRRAKDGQTTAIAVGPGRLSLLDTETGKRPLSASWQDKLISTRDGEYDLLHLTGAAAFEDRDNNQELRGDDLKVWLKAKPPAEPGKAAAPPLAVSRSEPDKAAAPPLAVSRSAPDKVKRRPHHIEALGNVTARSPEFNIRRARRFVVWFKDEKPPVATGPPSAPGDGPAQPTPDTSPPAVADAKPATDKGQRTKDKEPIDLEARSIEARVTRVGDKTELDELHCEGSVKVVQAPADKVVRAPGEKPEKGLLVTGEKLHLTHHPDGDMLVVSGSAITNPDRPADNDLAYLQTDQLSIFGPEVNINQRTNEAWVNGMGAMTMESASDFQGKKLAKPVPLTIHWDESMYFQAKFAEFHGGVQADQGNARLACQGLQVYFTQPISLKEKEKKDGQDGKRERGRVSHLVCDTSVHIEDGTYDKEGKPVRFQLLRGTEVSYDNVAGRVTAKGPGEVRTFQRGTSFAGPGVSRSAKTEPGTAAEKNEPTLTYVLYDKVMTGNNTTHVANFYTNVRVLHLPYQPSDNLRAAIDLDKVLASHQLPEGAMYLRCDHLQVLSQPRKDAKPMQELRAEGRVTVESGEFSGQAARIDYIEEKGQVIFHGGENGLAMLSKFKRKGEPAEKIIGRKIIYSRRTGEYSGDGIRTIQGQ